MEHKLGEIYCISHSKNEREYAIIIAKPVGAKSNYVLARLVKAKPYEYGSKYCVTADLPTHKEKCWINEPKLKISLEAYIYISEKELGMSFGKPAKRLNDDETNSLIRFINDNEACKREKAKLSSIKKNLHEKLKQLKKKKALNILNDLNYSAIEAEMDEISSKLGYKLTDYAPRKEQFREAPSKYIKVYLGGRGG
jgi:hypothetical protein